MNFLRKYISLFLLALFLFPLIEKEIHTLEHADTFHCMASDNHFHKYQHSCPICDFVVPITIASSQPKYDFSIFVSSNLVFLFHETKVISTSKYFASLRAPPIVA